MNATRYCQYCGSPMEPDWQFCEHCGGQPAVPQQPPSPEAAPTIFHAPVQAPRPVVVQPPAPRPAQPVPEKPKSSPKWLLPVGIGCVALVCLCAVAVGGLLILLNLNVAPQVGEILPLPTDLPLFPVEAATPTDWPAAPTDLPMPTDSLALTEAPEPSPWPTAADQLTGSQSRSDTAIFDDFSSRALGWSEHQDEITIVQYESGAYGIQVNAGDYYDWAYIPVDFWPNAIQFDAWSDSAVQAGTFGVFCQYQDENNYDYVEIDLGTGEFVMAVVRNGEHTPLTIPDEYGQYWLSAPQLNADPAQPDRIDLTCYPDFMVLAINDALVYHANIDNPFPNPGKMALFVYAYFDAGEQGYKVFFDNVGVQQSDE